MSGKSRASSIITFRFLNAFPQDAGVFQLDISFEESVRHERQRWFILPSNHPKSKNKHRFGDCRCRHQGKADLAAIKSPLSSGKNWRFGSCRNSRRPPTIFPPSGIIASTFIMIKASIITQFPYCWFTFPLLWHKLVIEWKTQTQLSGVCKLREKKTCLWSLLLVLGFRLLASPYGLIIVWALISVSSLIIVISNINTISLVFRVLQDTGRNWWVQSLVVQTQGFTT